MTTPLPSQTPLPTHNNPLPHLKQNHHAVTTLLDRYPLLDRVIPDTIYAHLIPFLAELLATTFYLFFVLAGSEIAFSPYSNSVVDPPTSAFFYAAFTSAIALGVTAWLFWRVTSGLFNPAITLGMCVLGRLGWVRGAVVIGAQMLGGLVAGGLVRGLVPGLGAERAGQGMEAVLRSGMGAARGFFLEMFLTAAFVFAVFMLAADKHRGTFLAPLPIALAALITHLIGTPYTSASLNPARAFGAAVASRHFPGIHWIYWLAPLIGGLLAAGMWKVVKRLEIETTFTARGAGNSGSGGDGFWGHRRGESRGQSERVVSPNAGTGMGIGMGGMEGHVLHPVEEHDLEKGPEHDYGQPVASGAAGHAGNSAAQPKPRYVSSREFLEASSDEEIEMLNRFQLSGLTAVNDASDTETSGDFQSPRSSAAASGTGRAA